jgi:diguanylate cyclase (GGDEF)-like protein
MNAVNVLYLTVILSWGSVISLMDQRLYGQLMVFMVNMIVCSIIYLMNIRMMSIPYVISTLILVIGLPFFQHSFNILFGHYVNLIVFVVISWIASRIVYRNYCDNYAIKKLMDQSELMLEKEMEEKKIINKKLEAANEQLKKLALVDELTGLSNRRSFNEFIGKMFQNNADSTLTVSVIMIDVDYFKQYNDTYGHDEGDLALIAIAKQINSMVENNKQIAVRWGGEEFLYLAFDKNRADILEIADTLRLKILNMKIQNKGSSICPFITISLGTCTRNAANIKDINDSIKMADNSLYLAKNDGRNCVATLTRN